MGNLKSILKKTVTWANIATNVLVWGAIGYLGVCEAKNILNFKPELNLEYKLTQSDYKQANYLEQYINQPVNCFKGLDWLDNIYVGETIMLTLAFYSYALTNMAISDNTKKKQAAEDIDKIIQKCMTPRIKSVYDSMFGDPFDPENKIKDNALYLGHLNLMMGAYQLLSGDTKYHKLHQHITDGLSEAILKSKTHHLKSWPADIWPADNTPVMASIDLYDKLNKADHSEAIIAWKKWTIDHALDENGLPYSHIDIYTNKPDAEARGCALGYSITFISQFDPGWARDLYIKYKEKFNDPLLGVPLFREWLTPNHPFLETDAGLVVLGRGTVASAFGIGAAKVARDGPVFSSLSLAAEIMSLPYEYFGKKGYLANISTGEAILLYCRTLRPWTKEMRDYSLNLHQKYPEDSKQKKLKNLPYRHKE